MSATRTLRLLSRVRIARGEASLAPVAVTGDAIYAGDERQQLVKIDSKDWRRVWEIPADGFRTWFVWREAIVTWSWSGHVRAIDAAGQSMWSVGKERTGWIRWDGSVLNPLPDFEVIDLDAGEVSHSLEFPEGTIGGRPLSSDLFLLRRDIDQLYDVRTRTILWERDLAAEAKRLHSGLSDSWSLVSGGKTGHFVMVNGKNLFCYSERDGRVVWHAPVWVIHHAPVLCNGRFYGWTCATPGYGNQFTALDEVTGRLIYAMPLAPHGGGFGEFQEPSPPAVSGDHMVFTTRSGLTAVFRLSDGGLVWSHQYNADLNEPVIAGGRLFVTSGDGHLLVFEGEPGVFPEDSVSR